jgi:signal transduction histidine kinase
MRTGPDVDGGSRGSQPRREPGAGTDPGGGDVVGLGLLVGVGVTLAALGAASVVAAWRNGAGAATVVERLLPVVAVTAADAVLLVWAGSRGLDRTHVLRLAGWAVGWSGLFAVVGLGRLAVDGSGPPVLATVDAAVGLACAGFVVGAFVGVTDVRSQRRSAERERARREVEQLAETLTVLNRVLRHDIRTDANVIGGYAELLADGDGSPEHARIVADRAEQIVELAAQARLAERVARADPDDRTVLDLAALTRAVVADVTGDCPGVHVGGDGDSRRDARTDVTVRTPARALAHGHELVETAIRNVVENAVEHTPDDATVRVTVEMRPGNDDSTPGRVCVHVADDGPGIPEAEVAAVKSGGESALEHSSGMGLWLVNWIADHSGGRVAFDQSELGGSAVVLSLPAVETGPGHGARSEPDGSARHDAVVDSVERAGGRLQARSASTADESASASTSVSAGGNDDPTATGGGAGASADDGSSI